MLWRWRAGKHIVECRHGPPQDRPRVANSESEFQSQPEPSRAKKTVRIRRSTWDACDTCDTRDNGSLGTPLGIGTLGHLGGLFGHLMPLGHWEHMGLAMLLLFVGAIKTRSPWAGFRIYYARYLKDEDQAWNCGWQALQLQQRLLL